MRFPITLVVLVACFSLAGCDRNRADIRGELRSAGQGRMELHADMGLNGLLEYKMAPHAYEGTFTTSDKRQTKYSAEFDKAGQFTRFESKGTLGTSSLRRDGDKWEGRDQGREISVTVPAGAQLFHLYSPPLASKFIALAPADGGTLKIPAVTVPDQVAEAEVTRLREGPVSFPDGGSGTLVWYKLKVGETAMRVVATTDGTVVRLDLMTEQFRFSTAEAENTIF